MFSKGKTGRLDEKLGDHRDFLQLITEMIMKSDESSLMMIFTIFF